MSDLEKPRHRALSARAVILGLVIAALVNIWIAWSEHLLHASRMNLSHFPLALFVAFLVLTIPLNIILKRINVRYAFTPSELLVVLAMGLASASVPASGLTGYLLGVIASPFYFASAENRWGDYFLPHIPEWLAPRDATALKWFFEGLPEGQSIPWQVWAVPLFWWLTLIAAIILVTLCIAVMFRRQWSRHERLTYPLVTVAQEMVTGAQERRILPVFMRGKLFWMGFALPFFIICWNMLNYFWPTIPVIPVRIPNIIIHPDFPPVVASLNFLTIGFSYFASPEVLFSVWFFYLLFMLQAGISNRIGFTVPGMQDWWSGEPTTGWLHFGGFFFLVVLVVWHARRHLKQVVLKALKPDYPVDDSEEMLSYRVAFWGLIIGLAYICFWLQRAGMSPVLVLLFVLATIVIHLGIARIVAESGVIYVRGPLSAQVFSVYTIGSAALPPAAMTALAFSYALIANGRGLFMPSMVHSVKLGELIRANKRKLCVAVVMGLSFGILVSIGFSIYLGYWKGALNFLSNVFALHGRVVFDQTLAKMRTPFTTSGIRLFLFGIGVVIAGGLTLLRISFAWWPLHPIGFAISGTYLTRWAALPVFIAWLAKTLILKIGGVDAYRKSKPFFLGLLTGYAFGVALSFVVDAIWFVGQGHRIHSW